MTTFCESVTKQCEHVISRADVLATNDVGEAMASASGYQPPSGGKHSGVGATLVFVILLTGCAEDPHSTPPAPNMPAQGPMVANPAEGITTELDGVAPAFGDGVLAELTGEDAAARVAYEKVLQGDDAPAEVAARAALRLAEIEARAGKSGRARDLIARATALAPADPAIIDGADRVRVEIVAAGSAGEVRGPPAGTPLQGVSAATANAFTAAEKSLARVHAMRPNQRLAVWEKEDATAGVVRRYRAIAEVGGLAQIAAEYRIGSLYHDLALGLLVEPPTDLRRNLRAGAFAYLKKAITLYRACLAAKPSPESELWRLAAETDLRAALDVLGEASQ